MKLKDVLQKFMNVEGWKDEIEHEDSDNTDFINAKLDVDGQAYTLLLITDHDNQTIKIILVSPIKIPKPRTKEAAIVMNGLNNSINYGSIGFQDDGTIYYRWTIYVEGATAASQQFATMVAAASSAFEALRGAAIGAAAFSKQSGEEILKDYQKEVAMAAN
jgi:hypothetical protein